MALAETRVAHEFFEVTNGRANQVLLEYYRGTFGVAFASNSKQYNGSAIVGKVSSPFALTTKQ
jgi:hypothetical protein